MRLLLTIIYPVLIIHVFTSCGQNLHQKIHMDVYPSFSSQYIDARQVEVYLPPGYHPETNYPVLYMHDGQNVFNSHTAFGGVSWEMAETMTRLIEDEKIQATIVVAIWNSPKRMLEYMPAQPAKLIDSVIKTGAEWDGDIVSDNYLAFLVKELKPFIDSTYSTLPGAESTYIMGSSMGGLISLYALLQHPDVFGGAGCVSTHWPALNGVFLGYVQQALPQPGMHKIYFDYGTATLDSLYEPYQLRVDEMMRIAGYTKGSDWETIRFEGKDHSEKAWAERVEIPLMFLLGR